MSCNCGDHGEIPIPNALVRRSFLSGSLATLVSLLNPNRVSAQEAVTTTLPSRPGGRPLPSERYGLEVRPRADWAKGIGAKGALLAEPDVRF